MLSLWGLTASGMLNRNLELTEKYTWIIPYSA